MIIQFDSVEAAKSMLQALSPERRPLLVIDTARLERVWRYCTSEDFEATCISVEFLSYEAIELVDRMFEENVFHRVKKATRFGNELRVYKREYLDCFGHEYQVLTTPF